MEQVADVAAVQRKSINLLRLDHKTESRGGCLHEWRLSGHGDRLGDRSGFQGKRQAHAVRDSQSDVLSQLALETIRRDRDAVSTYR